MPTAVRAQVNQSVQIGVESTPGTSVPANKLLDAFVWTLGAKPATKQFRGTGRQHPSASALLTEMSQGKISGPLDYAQVVYPLSSLYGAATIASHTGGVSSKDWKWTPPLVGSYAANAKTYTVQQGDAIDAEQYAFLVFHGFSYKFTRKAEAQITGDWFSQTLTDGISLTASPTAVAQNPAVGANFNMFLDSTSGGIGTTQLADVLDVSFAPSGFYDPYWPINRANASFTNIVDKEKKQELKFKVQANSAGIALKGSYLGIGARAYVRVSGQGPMIENLYTVSLGAPSAGTFTLTFNGQTTSGIAYTATAATVQTAIIALSSVGTGNCTVTGSTGGPYTVQFAGALANTALPLTGSGAGLTGGTFLVTAAPVYAALTHDMAVFIADVSEFSDTDGVYAVEYTCALAEDTGWGASGTAQILTLTNLLSAL